MQGSVRKTDDVAIDQSSWGTLQWLASKAAGNVNDVTLGRVTIAPGQSNPRHCHRTCEEVLHLLTGRLRHTVGDDAVDLEPGDTLAIDPGVFHNAINTGDINADMIVVYSTGERDFVLESEAMETN